MNMVAYIFVLEIHYTISEKMGILDDIVSPIKDAISDLTVPVKAAENLFGEVIDFTEDIINEIKNMINELENLFNASSVEVLFLNPFKDAALSAIGSIEKLFTLISSVSGITADGLKDELMVPLQGAYDHMKSALSFFKDEMNSMITEIENGEEELKRGLYHEFTRIASAIEVLPSEISILAKRIERGFKVEAGKAFAIIPEFGEMAEKSGARAFATIKKTGEAAEVDFEEFEQNVKTRMKNESDNVDLYYLLALGLVVAVIAAVFMLTHSLILVQIIMAFIVIVLISYLIFELIKTIF
jgi:hypothetical protein